MTKRKQPESFYTLLTQAINYFARYGFRTQKDLEYWVKRLRASAEKTLPPAAATEKAVRRQLQEVYTRMIVKGGAIKPTAVGARIVPVPPTLRSKPLGVPKSIKIVPGVSKFTIDKVKPAARAEFERSVLASVNLIKLNREEAIASTLRRFEGWVSSVPPTGAAELDKLELKQHIRAPLARMDFRERQVVTDQTAKFTQALNTAIAIHGKALAARWYSRWKVPHYDYREDHKERDGLYYAVPDNWAIQKGLMKPGPAGYVTDITQPAEEVNCKCSYVYVFGLADLPDEMLTEKGRESIAPKKK
jgi:hypothetical protein